MHMLRGRPRHPMYINEGSGGTSDRCLQRERIIPGRPKVANKIGVIVLEEISDLQCSRYCKTREFPVYTDPEIREIDRNPCIAVGNNTQGNQLIVNTLSSADIAVVQPHS